MEFLLFSEAKVLAPAPDSVEHWSSGVPWIKWFLLRPAYSLWGPTYSHQSQFLGLVAERPTSASLFFFYLPIHFLTHSPTLSLDSSNVLSEHSPTSRGVTCRHYPCRPGIPCIVKERSQVYKGYSVIQCVSLIHDGSRTFLVMPASQNLSIYSSSPRKTRISPLAPFFWGVQNLWRFNLQPTNLMEVHFFLRGNR